MGTLTMSYFMMVNEDYLQAHVDINTGPPKIYIFTVLLPTLIVSGVVWARYGRSPTVLSINVFFNFIVLVLFVPSAIRGLNHDYEFFSKWWLFIVSVVALGGSIYVLAFKRESSTHMIERNAQFLAETSSLVLGPVSFVICGAPFTSDWPPWIFANAVLALFFTFAALGDCVVPLLIVLLGLFCDVIKIYTELGKILPDSMPITIVFTMLYLGGCAAALIVTAPYVQPALKSLAARIKGTSKRAYGRIEGAKSTAFLAHEEPW